MLARGAAARPYNPGGVTESRRAAAQICADLREGRPLDAALERNAVRLDARDRRWLQELVFGMLRTRARLDALIEQRVNGGLARLDAVILDLLRLGAYQLLHMGSVPAYAAIAQTVELAKSHGAGASKLVNAVLRRLDRERDSLVLPAPADPVESLALDHSHPGWLVSRWVARFGRDETRALLRENNRSPRIHVRPYQVGTELLAGDLLSAGVQVERTPLLRETLVLPAGISIPELGAYSRGWFFVQDPAATLVTEYASVPEGCLVADLCAAPGGKSVELSRVAATVVAGDVSRRRMQTIRSNLERLRATSIHLFLGDAAAPPLRQVDAVLLDAPCTGTGTYRRHPDARWRIKVSDIPVMAALQRTLLRGAAEVVCPGGLLVYSTCSLEPEENDEQVEAFLAENTNWELSPPPEGAVPESVLDRGTLRVLPHRHGVDGAFAARLRRKE